MKLPQVLLVDRFPEAMREELQSLPIDLQYEPEWRRAEILAAMPEIDVLIMNSKTHVDRELLDRAPRLKVLGRAGVGMDHFDLPLLAERGVKVVNAPGMNARPVGEQAVGMLLAMLHRIPWANQEVQQFQWRREPNRGSELNALTVGVIGHGHTGSAFTRCLRGFGCRILAYDKYKTDYGNDWVEEADLETIFSQADVLSLHIPLTDETQAWITADFLSQFSRPIWLLNLARGPILPMQELVKALEAGLVIAAGLDVLENEKLNTLTPDQRSSMESLIASDRVIFTPHIGGWSHESLIRINNVMVQAVRDFISPL